MLNSSDASRYASAASRATGRAPYSSPGKPAFTPGSAPLERTSSGTAATPYASRDNAGTVMETHNGTIDDSSATYTSPALPVLTRVGAAKPETVTALSKAMLGHTPRLGHPQITTLPL